MGPFPHDAPPAKITEQNPAGTDGFEFVEFAHENPAKLEELFGKMGYAKVATHKTKAISVWRQGDINYIINAEPGSHAMKFVDLHGPCAASMAWRVVDARHAFEHAVSKGATPYEGDDKALDVLWLEIKTRRTNRNQRFWRGSSYATQGYHRDRPWRSLIHRRNHP